MRRFVSAGPPLGLLAARLVAAAVAVAVLSASADPALLLLGCSVYVAVAVLLALLELRSWERWLPYLGPAVDAAGLGLLLLAAGAPLTPHWMLGLLVPALAARRGLPAVAWSAAAVTSAVVAAGTLTPGVPRADTLLAAAILFGFAVALMLMIERLQRAQQQAVSAGAILRAAQRMDRATTADEVATAIVDGARDVTQADVVRLWRRTSGHPTLVPARTAGDATLLPDAILPPEMLAHAARGNSRLARRAFGRTPARPVLLPLPRRGQPLGLLALAWRPGTARKASARALRRLAVWASDALARVEQLESLAAAGRRAELARQALARFAAASTVAEVDEAGVHAVAEGIGRRAALVESPISGAGAEHPGVAGAPSLGANSLALAPGVTVQLEGPDVGPEVRTWFATLVTAWQSARRRAGEHERFSGQAHLLGSALDWLPAPLVVQDASGFVLASSRAFRGLGIEPPTPKSLVGVPFELDVGEARQFVVVSTRIDEQRYVTLYREVTEERAALQAKGELIATMGHDLKTPLTAVRGYSQIMARNLDVVREQIGRLDALIEDFVGSAQAVSRGQLQRPEALETEDLVGEATVRFRGAWEGRELVLAVEQSGSVRGDRSALGRVLDNLLNNAAKYSPPDRLIHLTATVDGGSALIRVRDEGQGIPAEHILHLFKRSYRIPGTPGPGQGLGLSIVQELVAAHGGEVWAESPGKGQGSCFVVRLPLRESREMPVEEPAADTALADQTL